MIIRRDSFLVRDHGTGEHLAMIVLIPHYMKKVRSMNWRVQTTAVITESGKELDILANRNETYIDGNKRTKRPRNIGIEIEESYSRKIALSKWRDYRMAVEHLYMVYIDAPRKNTRSPDDNITIIRTVHSVRKEPFRAAREIARKVA